MPRRPAAHRSRLATALALLCALAVLAGCVDRGEEEPAEPFVAREQAAQARAAQSDDHVDLKVYLRAGQGPDTHLRAVTRQVAIGDDLPRRALELLVRGPVDGDPAELRAPLPPTTRVLGLRVEGDTAFVDLSPEIVTDAAAVGMSAEHEIAALGAITNTLTEFPEIDVVRLTVAGHAAGVHEGVEVAGFWGSWGLPPALRRDESLIGAPAEGDGIPDVRAFHTEPQRIGSADAPAVSIRSVRTSDRVGYLRLILELGSGQDEPAKAVPPVRAAVTDGRLVLEIDDVLSHSGELPPGQRLSLADDAFEAVEADPTELPGTVRLGLVPGGRPFRLHTLTSPTRVVLDVRK